MEIRPIRQEEKRYMTQAQSIAFDAGCDFKDYKAPADYKNGRAVFNDDGKLCACADLLPMEMWLDGEKVKFGGIGGVASLPEERRKGYIRRLFDSMLTEMRQNEQCLSYLYPFSNAYYRKFGYETCMIKQEVTIPAEALRRYAGRGTAALYRPGEDDSAIRAVYDSFASRMNGMLARTDAMWEKKLKVDPYRNNRYVYVWRDGGNPRGYLIYKGDGDAYVMHVEELAWADPDALLGLLGFIGNFAGRYRSVIWNAPVSLNAASLVAEPYDLTVKLKYEGMARVVDAGGALARLTVPAGEGALIVRVRDDFLAWNNGAFRAAWSGGSLSVTKDNETEEPSLDIDVRALAQLVVGYLDPSQLAELGLLPEACVPAASALFSRRPGYICDHF